MNRVEIYYIPKNTNLRFYVYTYFDKPESYSDQNVVYAFTKDGRVYDSRFMAPPYAIMSGKTQCTRDQLPEILRDLFPQYTGSTETPIQKAIRFDYSGYTF